MFSVIKYRLLKLTVWALFLCLFSITSCKKKDTSENTTPPGQAEREQALKEERKKAETEALAKEQALKAKAKEAESKNQAKIPEVSVCERTEQVKQAILAKAEKTDCKKMTDQDLKAILLLDLEEKKITALKEEDFQGLTALSWLYLHSNQLTSLPANVFQGLTSLKRLGLSNNQIASLPANVFQGLTSLLWLNLQGNQIANLPANVFQGLTSLRWLYLSNNQLEDREKRRIERLYPFSTL